jgi:hypothetical protein
MKVNSKLTNYQMIKLKKKIYKNNEWPACIVYINGARRWFPTKYFSVGGYSLSIFLVLLVIIII